MLSNVALTGIVTLALAKSALAMQAPPQDRSQSHSSTKQSVIIGIAAAAVLVPAFVIIAYILYRKRRSDDESEKTASQFKSNGKQFDEESMLSYRSERSKSVTEEAYSYPSMHTKNAPMAVYQPLSTKLRIDTRNITA